MGLSCGVLKRNVRGCKGCGQCAAICPENAKLAMHLTYIPKASEYGARIYTRSKATKILVENGRAAGVEGEVIDGDRKTGNFRVRGKVVAIACGAIDTPLLLLKNRLCNFSGQVGKNLSVHPALRVSGFFDEKIEQWRGIVQGYYIDEFAGQGIMMQGLSTPPLIAALVLPYTGMKHKKLILKYDHFASIGVMVTDTSRGRVFLFRDDIFINYNLARRDAQNLGRAAAEAAKILFEAGAKKVYPHIYGVDELEKPDDVKKLQRMRVKPSYLELSSFHPLGTCRMGSNPRRSVVNPDLESHDVKNLFIIDGSVFPTPIGVNPQETIMAFSARAAKYICENIL
jgi:choline dehydrogenase-like flavoprotein